VWNHQHGTTSTAPPARHRQHSMLCAALSLMRHTPCHDLDEPHAAAAKRHTGAWMLYFCLMLHTNEQDSPSCSCCMFCAALCCCVAHTCAPQFMHMAPAEELDEQVESNSHYLWSHGVIHPLDRRYRFWWCVQAQSVPNSWPPSFPPPPVPLAAATPVWHRTLQLYPCIDPSAALPPTTPQPTPPPPIHPLPASCFTGM
jgi:hypothetical protein